MDLINDFGCIGCAAYEIYISAIFINEATKNMLILFIDAVDVIDTNNFFFMNECGFELAEAFEVGSTEYGALIFEAVYVHNIFMYFMIIAVVVVLFDDVISDCAFPGAIVSD